MLAEPKEQAKRIIVEIIRQAGGRFENKTNLFKAFWCAHMKYAESHVEYLSHWPIVRMPRGPGIHRFDNLLAELMLEGKLKTNEVQYPGFIGLGFETIEPLESECHLTEPQVDAIKYGVKVFNGKTAAFASTEAYKTSRTWKDLPDGAEIDAALEVIPPDEFEERQALLEVVSAEVDRVFERIGASQ